jgi:hypothetical protein
MAEGFRLDQRNFSIHVEDRLDAFRQVSEHIFDGFQAIEEGNRVGDFDFDFEGIDACFAAEDELVTGADALDIAENLLDLRREEIHAAEADKVIGPAEDPRHTKECPAAGTRLRIQRCNIARAVANQREALFCDCREHQFAFGADADGFERLGVDDFEEEMVFVDVESLAEVTFACDAGVHYLGEAVSIGGGDVQAFFQLLTQLVGPAFAAKEAVAQVQRFGVHAQFLQAGGDIDRVARRGNEGCRLEVTHYHNLLFNAGGKRRGNDGGADLLGPLLEAEAACEEVIIEGNLDDIVLGDACGGEKPCSAFGPVAEVVAREADDDGLARCAGGRVDAHDIAQGDSEHVVGVAFLQVFLCRERQLAQCVHVFDIFEIDAVGVEGLLVESDVAVDPVERGLQPFDLLLLDILPRHCLTFRIVNYCVSHNFLTLQHGLQFRAGAAKMASLHYSSILRYSLPR